MCKVGIKREIDKNGRLCVPKEMRDLLNLEGEVELVMTKEGIILRNLKFILVSIEEKEERL